MEIWREGSGDMGEGIVEMWGVVEMWGRGNGDVGGGG